MSTPTTISTDTPVAAEALRAAVRVTYTEVALDPAGDFPFPTGRDLAARLGYPTDLVAAVPDEAVTGFAGVDNPFAVEPIARGSQVVDLGSGGGFDSFAAGRIIGPTGAVIGVDMTPAMLDRARRAAHLAGAPNVTFREGILEDLPVISGWADAVIGNGTLNLVADKARVLAEAHRALRAEGVLQFAALATHETVPDSAQRDIARWTGGVAVPTVDDWCDLIAAAGFGTMAVGLPTPTFAGTAGEARARRHRVYGHTFQARKEV